MTQEADGSVDAYNREVRAKAALERAWRSSNDPARRKSMTDWLQHNVRVVDASGKWMNR